MLLFIDNLAVLTHKKTISKYYLLIKLHSANHGWRLIQLTAILDKEQKLNGRKLVLSTLSYNVMFLALISLKGTEVYKVKMYEYSIVSQFIRDFMVPW